MVATLFVLSVYFRHMKNSIDSFFCEREERIASWLNPTSNDYNKIITFCIFKSWNKWVLERKPITTFCFKGQV